jgi:parvulin-like peptidyl-prolyl isomerase
MFEEFRMKRLFSLTLTLVLAAGMTLSLGAQKRIEQIVARVNSDVILKSDIDREIELMRSELKADGIDGAKLEQELAERSKDILSNLIDRALLMQVAREAGLSAESDVIKAMDELRASRKLATMEELEKLIIEQLGDVEEFKNDMRAKFLTQRVIDHEVHNRIVITNEEMRAHYEANKEKYDRPKGIRLSAVVVLVDRRLPEQAATQRKKIEEALAAVKKGDAFEDVALKYSEVDSAANGGDFGFYGDGDLNETIQKGVGSLAKGEVSEILELGDALGFFKVTDKHEGGVLPFSIAQQFIWGELMSAQAPPKVREFLTRLRQDGFVAVNEGYVDTGAPAKP